MHSPADAASSLFSLDLLVSTQRNTHAGRTPANRKGVISEEKYRQQKDRVMTTGDCMNKNTDPVFIQEIQRMDPCAAHTSRTLQPTRRPRRSTESSGHLDCLLYIVVSQGGVTLSLTSHPSLSFHLAYSCHLSRPPHPFCLPLLVTPPRPPPPLFVVWPPLPA